MLAICYLIIHKEYLFLALLYFIYINLCAIFKEHSIFVIFDKNFLKDLVFQN